MEDGLDITKETGNRLATHSIGGHPIQDSNNPAGKTTRAHLTPDRGFQHRLTLQDLIIKDLNSPVEAGNKTHMPLIPDRGFERRLRL